MKTFIYSLLCCLAVYSTTSFTAISQPGSLDLTFYGDGKTTTGFMLPAVGHREVRGYSVAIQKSDGKIVVAGSFTNWEMAGNTDFAVVRYNPTGTLDNTFDLDGKIIT